MAGWVAVELEIFGSLDESVDNCVVIGAAFQGLIDMRILISEIHARRLLVFVERFVPEICQGVVLI